MFIELLLTKSVYRVCGCMCRVSGCSRYELGSVGSLNPNDCADQSSLRKQTQETALSPHLASFDEITERYGTLRSVTEILSYIVLSSTLLFDIRLHRKTRNKQIDIFFICYCLRYYLTFRDSLTDYNLCYTIRIEDKGLPIRN